MTIGIISLEASDDSGSQQSGQIRILTVSLHSPAPTRIPEYVDVRGPESQPGVLDALTGLDCAGKAIFDPGLITDGSENLLNELGIERGCHADRHRIHGGVAITSHSMKSLVPPVVGRNSKAWNRLGVVIHK